MSRKPKFKSDAFEAVHGAAADMLRTGTIDKTTMRRFDKSCSSGAAADRAGAD